MTAHPTFRRRALGLAVLLAAPLVAPVVQAEILSLSAPGFTQQCPCSISGNTPEINRGVLVTTDVTTVYANVDFPVNGQKVCKLTLVYHDINGNDAMTARLYRKPFASGDDPFVNLTTVASVSSASNVVNTIRIANRTLTTPHTINETNGFYYVAVSAPTINLNLLGVQIDYRATCP